MTTIDEYDGYDFDDRPEPDGEDYVFAQADEAWHRHQARPWLIRTLIELTWIPGRIRAHWINRRHEARTIADCKAGQHTACSPGADGRDGICDYRTAPF